MTQYKLVNANRGNEIIDLMHNYTHSMLSDVFRIPNELNLDGDDYEALHDQLLDDHNNNLAHVECCNPNQSTNQLNSFLTDDVLSVDEALFCILGLNITSKPYSFSILNLSKHKSNKALDSVISNTSEYRKLTKAIIAEESTGLSLVKSQYIYTKQFILWAIDKGFIYQEPDTNDQRHTNKNDKETGIPMRRYVIYTETLPKYLKKLKQSLAPISTNGLSTTDAGKLGKYFESNKNTLDCSAGTVRKDLIKLYKSTWWTSQPEEIRSKWQIKHK